MSRRRRLLLLAVLPPILLAAVRLAMWQTGFSAVDTAAHVYKAEQVRHTAAALFWDTYWYGGSYGVVNYGPLFYLLAAMIPGAVVAVLAAGSLPLATDAYLRRSYGVTSPWPALALAGVLCLYQVNGQDPFLLGLALMVGGLALLSADKPLWAALAVGLALFANPLAVFVGGVFLFADLVVDAGARRKYLRFVAGWAPFILVRGLLALVFAQPTAYLNELPQVGLALAAALLGALLAWTAASVARRRLLALFVIYAVACILAAVVRVVPLGNNVNRFALVFAVPLALACGRSRLPRIALVAVVLALAGLQLQAPLRAWATPLRPQATDAAFFAPALRVADRLVGPGERLHVVALKKHWEAYYFPRAGHAMTRGWYRQDDAIHNRLFLEGEYGEADYVAWLQAMGVRYVFLPHAPLDRSSQAEPTLLATSPSFRRVARRGGWTVYELVSAQPMVVPIGHSGRCRVLALDHRVVRLSADAAGSYVLKVSATPFWTVVRGACTVRATTDGFTQLQIAKPGVVVLQFSLGLGGFTRALR